MHYKDTVVERERKKKRNCTRNQPQPFFWRILPDDTVYGLAATANREVVFEQSFIFSIHPRGQPVSNHRCHHFSMQTSFARSSYSEVLVSSTIFSFLLAGIYARARALPSFLFRRWFFFSSSSISLRLLESRLRQYS